MRRVPFSLRVWRGRRNVKVATKIITPVGVVDREGVMAVYMPVENDGPGGAEPIERLGADVPVPAIGQRLRCSSCGGRQCDARPNWPTDSMGV